jgi:hypothetical protein
MHMCIDGRINYSVPLPRNGFGSSSATDGVAAVVVVVALPLVVAVNRGDGGDIIVAGDIAGKGTASRAAARSLADGDVAPIVDDAPLANPLVATVNVMDPLPLLLLPVLPLPRVAAKASL